MTADIRLETAGIGSISVIKRFSLPDRVPFGVSGGSFAIGVEPSDSQRGTGLREGLDRESRLNERSDKAGKEYKSGSSQGLGITGGEKASAASRTSQLSSSQGTSGGSKKASTLSASPVGNYYLYSFDGKLLQTYNVYGTCLKDYIYMGGRLIAEYDHVGSRYLYYTPDQINSTRVVTNDAGTVVYSAAHDPYGGIQQTWVNTFDPMPKFSGKERDEESQLDYFGARYYDKAQYRFISVDPIISRQIVWFDPQLWNLYPICFNNPISLIDRTGEFGGPVHRQMTVRTGLMVGMPLKLAVVIAEANMAVDTNRATSSGNPFHIVSGVMMKWHFPTEARYHQMMRLARTTLDPVIFGQSLHVIQDSFSHDGYSNWGHGGDSVLSWFGIKDDPDDPESDWGKAEDATLLTEWLMKMFWERYLNSLLNAITAIFSALTLFGGTSS